MASYPEFVTLEYAQDYPPPNDHDCSDQYPSSLADYFIQSYSRKGQRVLDPFLGFGTTAFAAERSERIPYGVEADGERFEWAAGQLAHWQNIRCDDSANIAGFGFPKMDLCLTSPPFMPRHEKWNPLYSGDPKFSGYDVYLTRMSEIFTSVCDVMKKNGIVIVHADNINHKKSYTPLIRDLSVLLSQNLRSVGETIVQWDGAPDGRTHTQCLIFKKD